MAETTNYGLFVTGDSTTKFKEWRERMAGVSGSNMTIIDEGLAGKAGANRVINAVLLATDWLGVVAPYTQSFTAEGVVTTSNGIIQVQTGVTAEQRAAAREAAMSVESHAEGIVTIVADGEPPEVDIPVCIILFG